MFDLETTGLSWQNDEAIQIACIVLDARSLEIIPGSEFESLVRPVGIMNFTESDKRRLMLSNKIPEAEQEAVVFTEEEMQEVINEKWMRAAPALNVNKKKREVLEQAALPQHVWKNFTDHVAKYNHNKKNSAWDRPIAAGHNIQGFDMLFIEEACKKYGPVGKDGRQAIFNQRTILDTLNLTFMWFENTSEPQKLSLDVLRDYFGISLDGGHDALVDVKTTADILVRFLKMHRRYAAKQKFKGAFRQ